MKRNALRCSVLAVLIIALSVFTSSAIDKVNYDDDDDDYYLYDLWSYGDGYIRVYNNHEFGNEYLRADGWRMVLDSTDSNGLYLLNINTLKEVDHNVLYRYEIIKIKNTNPNKTRKVKIKVKASKVDVSNPLDTEQVGLFPDAKLKIKYYPIKTLSVKVKPNKTKVVKVKVPAVSNYIDWERHDVLDEDECDEVDDPIFTRVKTTVCYSGYNKTKKNIILWDNIVKFSIN